METRTPGPANLQNHNAVMGCLRGAGFSFETAIHAYSVQDAYIYGFAQQEKTLGFQTPGDAGEAVQRRAQEIGALDTYPYLAEIATKLPESGYETQSSSSGGSTSSSTASTAVATPRRASAVHLRKDQGGTRGDSMEAVSDVSALLPTQNEDRT